MSQSMASSSRQSTMMEVMSNKKMEIVTLKYVKKLIIQNEVKLYRNKDKDINEAAKQTHKLE